MMDFNLQENHAMNQNELLIENIDRLHTTPMGIDRIKRNLQSDTDDVVGYCKDLILNPQCRIARHGKNWCCETGKTRITVNSYSYTIITAHAHTNASEKSAGKRELK